MPNAVQVSFLEWLATEDTDRAARYAAYRQYYDGNHDTQITRRMRRYLELKIGEEFNDNYCPIVVDALVDRLTVTGFEADDADQLWKWWQANRMDGVQGIVHTAAVRDGDAYVLVEHDGERPVFSDEPAWDGHEGIKVHYSKEHRRQIAFASKRWRVEAEGGSDAGKARRINLYYPDRVEKYISHDDHFDGNWSEYREDGKPWPLPWTHPSTNEPLGVPVIHFKNRDQGYNYGASELRDVIPIQNALNKSIIDMLAAADLTGFRLYLALGFDPGTLDIAPGQVIYTTRPPSGEDSADFRAINGEDLRPLIALKDSFVTEIARISRTPLSYFQVTGQIAAEGTQKQQEAGLVSRAKDRQVAFGNAWEDALIMARRVHSAFGGGPMPDQQAIGTQWADPETRNEREHLESLRLKAELGVDAETLLGEMGYNADQRAEIMARRAGELAAQSNIGGELLRAFEGGAF